MSRREGWEIALAQTVSAGLKRPHAWGENDCVTFAADCVCAMTGEDPLGDIRGSYDSPLSAAKVITEAGHNCLGDMLAAHLDEIPKQDARRGDVVLCWSDDGEFVGVVERHTAVGPGPNGVVHVPLLQVSRAFKI